MRDRGLYAKILGISDPSTMAEVELMPGEQTEEVLLAHRGEAPLLCPECRQPSPGYDTRTRTWRHLDTMQYHTLLVAEVPRVKCDKDGVHQVKVPWAEPGTRFTALFACLVIDWLKEASVSAIARTLGLSSDEVDGIMARAVRRGLARREQKSPRIIAVDEKAFRKG